VEPLREQRDAIVGELYREGADLAAGGRAALLALAALYARHGRLLRALAEASSQDREAKRAWKEFLEPVIKGHAEKIREEIAQGRIAGVDPEPTARALIGMNLQYFFDQLVDPPPGPRGDCRHAPEDLVACALRHAPSRLRTASKQQAIALGPGAIDDQFRGSSSAG
jgi:hypothetical protein